MSSEERNDMATEAETREALDNIEESLAKSLPDDPRLQSGISKTISGDDPKFIEMSGLVTVGEPSSQMLVRGDFVEDEDLTDTLPPATTVAPEDVLADTAPQREETPVAQNGLFEMRAAGHEEKATEGATPVAHDALTQTEPLSHIPLRRRAEAVSATPHGDETPAVVDLAFTEGEEPDAFDTVALLRENAAPESTASTPPNTRAENAAEVVVGGESVSHDLMADEDWNPLPAHSNTAEADELLSELQAQIQTREVSPGNAKPSEPHRDDTEASEAECFELPTFTGFPDPQPSEASVPCSEQTPDESSRKRSKRHRRKNKHLRGKVVRFVIAIVTLATLSVVGAYAYEKYQRMTATPDALFAAAERATENGDFSKAIMLYDELLRRHPDYTQRGTAQFSRAVLRQTHAIKSGSASEAVLKELIADFETFLKDNPGHPKSARAETLLGLLCVRLGDYSRAIKILSEPELRLRDSAASLSILRALARAHLMAGNTPAAQQYLQQAATLEVNPSPDKDYDELGNLFLKLAESAVSEEDRVRYQQMALLYWERATGFPGISPPARNAIQNKIDVLKEKMKSAKPSAEPTHLDENTHGQGSQNPAPEAQTGSTLTTPDAPMKEAEESDGTASSEETKASHPANVTSQEES